jgi:peptide chain release factor 1
VLLGDVVDQLLDQHRLAHAGAAEQADLAALHVRGQQIDHLDAGLEDLDRRRQVGECGRLAVDLPALAVGQRVAVVNRLAQHVEDPAQRHLADRHRDLRAGVDHVKAAGQAVGRVHRDRAHTIVAEVLLHLRHQRGGGAVGGRDADLEGVVDRRQPSLELRVDDDALDLDDLPDVVAIGG